MERKIARVGLLGGKEEDLHILSELHKKDDVEIAFLYESVRDAIGLDIVEIIGIPRFTAPHELAHVTPVDYLVVSEPRERFEDALGVLSAMGAKLLTANEALLVLCREERLEAAPARPDYAEEYSIEDALQALEKLFDRKELLKFLLDISVRYTSATAGSIMLHSADADELYIGYATGLSDRVVKNTRQKLGEGIAGTVAMEKRAKLLRLRPDETLYARDRERVNIATAISVPLLWENQLLGVLNVSTNSGERELDNTDFENMKKISRRISKVLAGSLKVQEIQVRHQEQSLRNTVGELTEKPAAFQEKVYQLSIYLSELLGIDTVEIYVNTHEGDWFLLGGSNSRFASQSEKVRCEKGVLSRCFLERRPIIMRELIEGENAVTGVCSSFVFHPLSLIRPLGVLVAEFSDRHKLEEFLVVKDSVGFEIARFISSEIRSHTLERELGTMARVSEVAPAIMNCRTISDLGELLSRTIADVLECDHVSTRFKSRSAEQPVSAAFYHAPGTEGDDAWVEKDESVFSKLLKKLEPFSEARLTFEPAVGRMREPYQSFLASPIRAGGAIAGGIIAYDKHASSPLEESIFTDFDRTVVDQVLAFANPVLEALSTGDMISREETADSFETLLADNRKRLLKACEREIQRSDRYHYPFSFLLFKLKPLLSLFESDHARALELVEEITTGIRTRTRKTDCLSWITKDSFAILSLEGSRRVKFLVSRITLYLTKDLEAFGTGGRKEALILLGQSYYPGTAGSAEELLREAEQSLKPHQPE